MEKEKSSIPFLIQKEEGRSTIRVYLSEPTPLEEKNLGMVFLVSEIDSDNDANNTIIDTIIDEIETQYYHSDTFDIEPAFEHALKIANAKVAELVQEYGEDWLQNINIIAGVKKEHTVVFTTAGRVMAMMTHDDNIIDIIDATKGKGEVLDPEKFFNNTVNGDLPKNSILFFGTDKILDYLSQEKIKRVLRDNGIEDSIEQFDQLLKETTGSTNFAGLLFAAGNKRPKSSAAPLPEMDITAQKPHAADPALNRAHDSMSKLVGQETRTEELLSSSIWPSLKKAVSERFGEKKNKKPASSDDVLSPSSDYHNDDNTPAYESESSTAAKGPSSAVSTALNVSRKGASVAVKGAGVAVSSLWKGFGKSVTVVKDAYASRKSGGRTPRSTRTSSGMKEKAVNTVSRVIDWFMGLTVLQKGFFVVAFFALVLFAHGIVTKSETRITNEDEAVYSQTMEDIDLKINNGKAAALYDKEKAREIFIEAKELLASIPEESDIYDERGEEVASTIDAQLQRVNNIIAVSPSVLVDYASINSDVSMSEIVLLGASMYAFDGNSGSVYRGNLETRDVSAAITADSESARFTSAVKASPGTAIVLRSDQSVGLFNPISEAIEVFDLGYTGEHNLVDVDLFGTRLYTLDIADNTIYRHERNDTTYGAGAAWLSDDSVSLADARSLSIDGEIYVLSGDGTVVKLSGGSRVEFSLASIDPSLTNADKLITNDTLDNLYVVDTAGKRVVVFTKEGKLVAQYISDAFDGIQDVVVDEDGGKFYVLASSKLYEVQIQEPTTDGAPTEEVAE